MVLRNEGPGAGVRSGSRGRIASGGPKGVVLPYNLTQEGVGDDLIELTYLEPRFGKTEVTSN